MIVSSWFVGDDNIEEIKNIRRQVFVQEQCIQEDMEYDDKDKLCEHLLVCDGKKAVATGRLLLQDNKYFIEKVAVLKEFRGEKFGDFILRLLIRRAFEKGGEIQYAYATTQTQAFFQKLGFKANGQPFQNNGLQLIEMVHQGDVTGNCCL